MSSPLDAARLEEILTEIGARLLAGERFHGAGGAFTVDVDLGTAARAVVEAGACRSECVRRKAAPIRPASGTWRVTSITPCSSRTRRWRRSTNCARRPWSRPASVCVNSGWSGGADPRRLRRPGLHRRGFLGACSPRSRATKAAAIDTAPARSTWSQRRCQEAGRRTSSAVTSRRSPRRAGLGAAEGHPRDLLADEGRDREFEPKEAGAHREDLTGFSSGGASVETAHAGPWDRSGSRPRAACAMRVARARSTRRDAYRRLGVGRDRHRRVGRRRRVLNPAPRGARRRRCALAAGATAVHAVRPAPAPSRAAFADPHHERNARQGVERRQIRRSRSCPMRSSLQAGERVSSTGAWTTTPSIRCFHREAADASDPQRGRRAGGPRALQDELGCPRTRPESIVGRAAGPTERTTARQGLECQAGRENRPHSCSPSWPRTRNSMVSFPRPERSGLGVQTTSSVWLERGWSRFRQ